jgi:hypothetical protein
MTVLFPFPGTAGPASREVARGEFYMRIDPRLIGFTASSRPRAVSIPGLFDFLRLAVPSTSVTTSSSSSRARLLFRVPSPLLLALRLSARASPAWVLALFATSPVRSYLLRRAPSPSLRSVLGFSQPLDVLLRARARRLVSSRCHVQGLPFRGFSPRAATLPHRKEPAPMPLRHLSSPCGCRFRCLSTPRLYSARGRVDDDSVIHQTNARSPLQVSLLQGPRSLNVGSSLPSTVRS